MTAAGTLVAVTGVGSSLPVCVLVAVALVLATVPVAHHLSRVEGNPWLGRVVVASAVLHLVCAPLQIYVIDHFYHGVSDWTRYVHQGALLADNWRAGHFTTAGTGIGGLVGLGMVSVIGGVVMTVVGPDQLATFLVFAWLAFAGTVCFYRAFSITFPEADRRRYAVLVFFFPSILFWTADLGKESIILVSMGVASLGIARVLARLPGGYLLVVAGTAIGAGVRPDELLVLVVAFVVAFPFRRVAGDRPLTAVQRGASVVFLGALAAVVWLFAAQVLHHVGGASLGSLSAVAARNQGQGTGFGSSGVSYHANPLSYPVDVYHVLFDPLPFSAHSTTQLLAAAENTVILVVLLASLRQLRLVLRAGRQRAYVIVCLVYSVVFVYLFAALGNLGLITRERTLLLPFLLVLFSVPVSPAGAEPYPWERRRSVVDTSRGSSPTGQGDGDRPASGADPWVAAPEPHSAPVAMAGEPVAGSWVVEGPPASSLR